jgi:hypothetical protein
MLRYFLPSIGFAYGDSVSMGFDEEEDPASDAVQLATSPAGRRSTSTEQGVSS